MRDRISDGSREYLLSAEAAGGEPLAFQDDDQIRALLLRVSADPENLATLRNVLGDAADLDDAGMLDEAAKRLARRELVLVSADQPMRVVALEEEEEEKKSAPAKIGEKTWIAFRVVEDATGRPLTRVRFKLRLPDGSESDITSGPPPWEFKGVPEGECSLTSDLQDVTLDRSWILVGSGERETDGVDPIDPGAEAPLLRIADHELKLEETLDDVAQEHATTFETLARYNWATTDRAEVAKHLEMEEPSASVEEGWIRDIAPLLRPRVLIPKSPDGRWTTMRTHTLRVRRWGEAAAHLSLELRDEEGRTALPGVAYTIEGPQGERFEGITDEQGRLEHGPVPHGYYRLTVRSVEIRELGLGLRGGESPVMTYEPRKNPEPPPECVLARGDVLLLVPSVSREVRALPQAVPRVSPRALAVWPGKRG